MKISEAFPGKFLRAADLQGREATKRIAYCEREKVGQNGDIKPVLHFMLGFHLVTNLADLNDEVIADIKRDVEENFPDE